MDDATDPVQAPDAEDREDQEDARIAVECLADVEAA
jgi:hypothetical protein